jgi:hypothetical protein
MRKKIVFFSGAGMSAESGIRTFRDSGGLWEQYDNRIRTKEGLLLDWVYQKQELPQTITAPALPVFYKRDTQKLEQPGMNVPNGFTVDLAFSLKKSAPNQLLVDARDSQGKGWYVQTTAHKTVELVMNDGRTQSSWACDEGLLTENQPHYVSIVVDGGPKIVAFVVDGLLNDGGETRQFGWGRFSPYLKSVSGASHLTIGKNFTGTFFQLSVYNRALTISEAIGNYRFFKR